MDKRDTQLLVMGKRVMKEWVVIRREDPEENSNDLALFKEAMAYASSK